LANQFKKLRAEKREQNVETGFIANLVGCLSLCSLPRSVLLKIEFYGYKQFFPYQSFILWVIPALLVFGTYGLMLLIPKIDPKGQVQQMGNKYEILTFVMVVMMAAMAVFIIHAAKGGGLSTSLLLALLGLFYVVLGNYFPTIKHNYFIGIKTPWTLESEEVWRKTHQLAGPLWMVGGLLIVLVCLLLKGKLAFGIFMGITMILAFIPIVYSYIIFKKA